MCVRRELNISDSRVQEKKIRGGSKLFQFSISVSLQLKSTAATSNSRKVFSGGRRAKLFDAIWGLAVPGITMQLVDTLVIIYDTHAHYPGDGEQRFPLVGSERFWSSNLCQNNRPMHFLRCSTTGGGCRRLRLPGVSSDLDKYLPQYERYAKTAAAPPLTLAASAGRWAAAM